MVSYKDLIRTGDDVIPPSDTLSEAIYNNSRLEHIFGGISSTETSQKEAALTQVNSGPETTEAKPEQDPEAEDPTEWHLLRVLAGAHQGWVRSVTVDPVTNQWFATGSSDSTIKVWDLASLQLKTTITGHIMGVRALEVSSKYPYLFSGSEDKTVKCWDLERTNSASGSEIRNFHGHVGGIYAMALHPELDLLFTGGRDSVVRVWDIRSKTEVMVLTGHRSDISSIASQTGDPQIVSSSMDSTVRLWDIRKQTTALTLTHHTKSVRLMAMHPQEMTMCSGDSSGNLKQWVLPGGELLNEFNTPTDGTIINTLSINPSTSTLFAGYDNGKMEFYNYVSGNLSQATKSIPVPGANEAAIYASAFDKSGLRLIVCEGDKSIKIWGEN